MRTFTVDEAQTLLPVLESLLRQAMESKAQVAEIDEELQNLGHRIFLQGGLRVDVPLVARRRAERDKALQRIKDALAEIDSIGVQVKDLDIGLLDFPCLVDDEVILLCWKVGEEGLTHWHGLEEGFQGRKPIDERIRSAKKQRPN